LLAILCHVYNRQHSLLWQFVESGIDKRLCQFCSISLPQVPAAFHELQFGSVAANSQERFKFIYRQPETPLKLFIYSVVAEHCAAPACKPTHGTLQQSSHGNDPKRWGNAIPAGMSQPHEFEGLARGPKLDAMAR
jgi:hypothetical protein